MKFRIFNILLISLPLLAIAKDPTTSPPDSILNLIYQKSQREFHRKNYDQALPLLEKYIIDSKGKSYKKERLFWVIDQVGRIHLRENKNPDAAIKFFEKALNDERLTEEEEDDIAAWIHAAKDWKKLGKMPTDKSSELDLFKYGKMYYEKGQAKKSFPADDAGNAYFNIARTYLVPLIVNFDNSKHLGQSLFMMGDIQRHLRTDLEYWNDNYYLKETIRRYPHSDLALKAWKSLKEDVELGYTGTSGSKTPDSLYNMLNRYKQLAEPIK